jgi:hypothetical protein
MLKKISFFAFVALLFAGCSSDNQEKKEKKRDFKESVYAFVNSNPDIVGYGRVDLRTIMDEGNIEQVGIYQLFVAETFDQVKKQVDINTPVYFATTTTEGHSDMTLYAMLKLKSKKELVQNWTDSGYEFKEHKGISYAEDEGLILAAKDNVAMMVIIPGDFDGKKIVSNAFKYADGKKAPDQIKKQLEAEGDFVMHMNVDPLRPNVPMLAAVPQGAELDVAMNFDKGEVVFESKMNDFDKMKSQLSMEMTKEPIIAKKVNDENGNMVMAVQLSAKSPLMDMIGMNDEQIEKSMNIAPFMLSGQNITLSITKIEDGEQIEMPSGKMMGGEFMELVIDLDVLMSLMPEYQPYKDYWSKMDAASLSINQDGTLRLVITSDEKGKNFLATVFGSVEEFMNNGGMQMLLTGV